MFVLCFRWIKNPVLAKENPSEAYCRLTITRQHLKAAQLQRDHPVIVEKDTDIKTLMRERGEQTPMSLGTVLLLPMPILIILILHSTRTTTTPCILLHHRDHPFLCPLMGVTPLISGSVEVIPEEVKGTILIEMIVTTINRIGVMKVAIDRGEREATMRRDQESSRNMKRRKPLEAACLKEVLSLRLKILPQREPPVPPLKYLMPTE